MYLRSSGRLRDGESCLRFFLDIIRGVKPLKEHAQRYVFNQDGTISLHKETPGLIGDPTQFVAGYGHDRFDKTTKRIIWVPARDPRRLHFAFKFEPEVSGVQRAEWLSVQDIRELVPLLLRESPDRARGIHDSQPLLFRANPGTGKTWSMLQLHYLLAKACSVQRPTDGVPLVPILVRAVISIPRPLSGLCCGLLLACC